MVFVLAVVMGANSKKEMVVEIENIKKDKPIYVAVFNKQDKFLDADNATATDVAQPGGKSSVQITFNLPPGEYAVSIFQDVNEDGKMNKNMFGAPSEPYGFSNGFKPKFSAPTFEDCKVNFTQSKQKIVVPLR